MLYTLAQNSTVMNANGPATKLILALKAQSYTLWATNVQGAVSQSDEIATSGPTRDFVVIDFAQDKLADVTHALDTVFNKPSALIYQLAKTNDKKLRLIIDTAQELNGNNYKNTYRNICIQLNLVINKTQSLINHGIVFKPFADSQIVYQSTGAPYSVPTNIAPASIMPNKDKLLKATQEFVNSQNGNKILHDHTLLTNFFDALAAIRIKGQIDSDYLKQTLKMIGKRTKYDPQKYSKLLTDRINLLKANPDQLETAPPFGDYIHLYSQATYVQTIGQQLIANLPEGKGPSSDYELAEASDFIEMAYPPYLLEQHGNDLDNVVIFNPTTGVWTHQTDILYSLLTAIRPYSTKQQFDTFMMTFAAKARNSNRTIKSYSGSRYILFDNCVLDVATMQQYDITDPIVRSLHFTERCHVNLDYVPNPPLPILKHKRQFDNGDWDPQSFLKAYANNDEDAFNYLLFGFALGLFGGHNSGVHFDIYGGSRWGKTTLSEIFKSLYDNRIIMIPFSSLNEQFPFTSYPNDTAIIWINECNKGVEPLDDKYGTMMYDSLADSQVRFQVKNRGDLVLSNPPQVYLDGTQPIKANELDTGPAGRTLAFKLPEMTTALRNQAYSSSINECLRDKKVLQWIVYQALMAYKKFIPVDRMDDLRLNLANQTDLDLFPKVVQAWRKEFVIGGSAIDDWFEDSIAPFLSRDAANPTYLRENLLYDMYLEAYKTANPNDTYFNKAPSKDDVMRRLQIIWKSEPDKYIIDTNIGSLEKDRKYPRKAIANPDKMNFDWKGFDDENSRPISLRNGTFDVEHVFTKKIQHWFTIYVEQK